jgi:hypothetical protein
MSIFSILTKFIKEKCKRIEFDLYETRAIKYIWIASLKNDNIRAALGIAIPALTKAVRKVD